MGGRESDYTGLRDGVWIPAGTGIFLFATKFTPAR